MAAKQHSVVLVFTLLLCVGAVIFCYRTAERAKVAAEAARRAAVASAEAERTAQNRGDVLEQDRDTQLFFAQYYQHVLGVRPLSEPELNVVRPSIAGDEQMTVVLNTFEADLASVNQLLSPDRQVSNYHDAIAACRTLLDKNGN